MMNDMMKMWGMGLVWLLVVIVLILAAAALMRTTWITLTPMDIGINMRVKRSNIPPGWQA
jgi:hypothetical protein